MGRTSPVASELTGLYGDGASEPYKSHWLVVGLEVHTRWLDIELSSGKGASCE
ncbi:hypothetical protein ACJIZ3_025473 [Penstemon smallii]|uniref:Transposase n=1 Tax=Penstemon smallii TaxID=265156 RepID=A0ABD3TVR6_9LAMI